MFSRTEKKQETWEEYRERMRPLVEADIPRQREREAQLLTDYEDALRLDREAFHFRAERFGDHLALFITGRGYNGLAQRAVVKEAHAVSIATGTITLREGRAPDMNGWKNCSKSGDGDALHWSEPWHGDWHEPGYGPGGGRFLKTDPKPNPKGGGMVHYSDNSIGRMDGAARAADDDVIRFEGGRATLSVPFGLGQQTYQQILTALSSLAP